MPLILVTNDDGIVAPGIRALVSVARQLGEVVVVAPDSPQSGMGHAITIHDPIRLRKVRAFEDIEAWECSGTPVDCVKLAKHVVLKDRKIDLCVSGINHGSNASINIIYSGTLSAAMEASVERINSIGFSLLDFSFEADFEPAKIWVRRVMEYVLAHGIAGGRLLNVNIPRGDIRGMKVCRQADARWVEKFIEGRDPSGQPYYWLSGEFVNEDNGGDTDIEALSAGYISIVPAMHDLTDYGVIPQIKSLEAIAE
ncbi:MAG: 5'/3'-nucleotidase SurE [Saprospiraceae bacterium]